MNIATTSTRGTASAECDTPSLHSSVDATPLPIWNDGIGTKLTPLPGPVLAMGVDRCKACRLVFADGVLTPVLGIGKCCWPCIDHMRNADVG